MITAENATKRFGDITAVDHVCAEVRDGSVYGLIGSNGAQIDLPAIAFLPCWQVFCPRTRARCASTGRIFLKI